MCEYCGCQALDSIAQLTAEHEEVVNVIGLAREAIAAADVVAAAAHARTIAHLLEPHTAVEEEGLFPALARDFPEHVEHLVGEHRSIEAVLAEAILAGADVAGAVLVPTVPAATTGSGTATPARLDVAWLERLGDALHTLREHILAEQDGAFPAALGALDTEDWDRVDAVRARVGTRLDRVPEPRP